MEIYKEYLELSMTQNKGIILYFDGQSINGVVTNISLQGVELKNREFGRIFISGDKISGVALN